ncbi:MAG: tetratricopeptide repeat protein [Calditrichia bacterium]
MPKYSVRWSETPLHFIRLTSCITLLVFLSSCAYYNTLFNAKQSYNDGIKELEKAGGNSANSKNLGRNNSANSSKKFFETTIEKCWKLIEIYSDENKYADDALLYIAKSEFHLQKYSSAKLHLDQFLKKYPRSDLLAEANLFYAKTLLRENDVDEANRLFRNVLSSSKDGNIRSQANLELGLFAFENQDYQEAISHLEDALKEDISDEDRSRLHYNLGESYYIQKKYKEALKQYQDVEKYQPSVATDYQSRLQRAKTLARLEQYDDANKLLRKMLTAPRFQTFIPVIRNAIGENYQRQGLLDDAVETYREIVRDRRSSSGTAQAAVNLARLYEYTFNDIDSAVTYYSKVKTLFGRYDSLEAVQNKSRFLGEFKEIRDKIDNEEKLISRLTYDETFRDSLYRAQFDDSVRLAEKLINPTADPEDLEDDEDENEEEDPIAAALRDTSQTNGQNVPDSLKQASNTNPDPFAANEDVRRNDDNRAEPPDEDGRRDDFGRGRDREGLDDDEDDTDRTSGNRSKEPDKKKKPLEKRKLPQIEFDYMNNRFALAEYYLLKVENEDSASHYYQEFLSTYDDSVLTPKAVYSLIYIHELEGYEDPTLVDSLEKILVNEYPNSLFSRDILQARGIIQKDVLKTKEEQAEKLFREAEKLYFDGSVQQAFNTYSQIARVDTSLEVSAKAQYARAWIFEYDFQQTDSSLNAYKMLIDRYPLASEYVSMARAKTQPLTFADNSQVAAADNLGADKEANTDESTVSTGAVDFELAGEDIFEEKVAWRKQRNSKQRR